MDECVVEGDFKKLKEIIDVLGIDIPQRFGLINLALQKVAVFASLVRPRARSNEPAVHQALYMSEDDLDESYQRLAVGNQLGPPYMSAIDSFRAASLFGPAFVELVDCLKQIEDPSVRMYLKDKELEMILEIYRQAPKSPDTMVLECAVNRLRQGYVVRPENPVGAPDTKLVQIRLLSMALRMPQNNWSGKDR